MCRYIQKCSTEGALKHSVHFCKNVSLGECAMFAKVQYKILEAVQVLSNVLECARVWVLVILSIECKVLVQLGYRYRCTPMCNVQK